MPSAAPVAQKDLQSGAKPRAERHGVQETHAPPVLSAKEMHPMKFDPAQRCGAIGVNHCTKPLRVVRRVAFRLRPSRARVGLKHRPRLVPERATRARQPASHEVESFAQQHDGLRLQLDGRELQKHFPIAWAHTEAARDARGIGHKLVAQRAALQEAREGGDEVNSVRRCV